MKTKTIFSLLFVLLVGLVAVTGAYAFGFGKGLGPEGKTGQEMPGNEAAKQAIANNDYTGFVSAMSDSHRAQTMTEEQFARIVEMRQKQQTVQNAIETGDYNAWIEAHNAMRQDITKVITAENFDKFAEMHKAMQNGNVETAKQIAEELGIENGLGRGMQRFGMGGPAEHRRGTGMPRRGFEMHKGMPAEQAE